MKCSHGISNFPEAISSLSHSIVFLYFFALIAEEGFLISPCYYWELCIQMGVSFLFSFAFGKERVKYTERDKFALQDSVLFLRHFLLSQHVKPQKPFWVPVPVSRFGPRGTGSQRAALARVPAGLRFWQGPHAAVEISMYE